jgi:ribosome-associated protein
VETENLAKQITEWLDYDKAENITLLDIRGRSNLADFLIIANSRSSRHAYSVADNIMKKLKSTEGISIQGLDNCEWVLMDVGRIIIHLFRPETREYYNLESLWDKNESISNK